MPAPTPLPPWRFAPRPSRPAARRLRRRHHPPGAGATAVPPAAPAVRCARQGRRHSGSHRGERQRRGWWSFERGEREGDRERFPTRSPTHRHQPGIIGDESWLEPEDGSADVFCHLTVAQASGHDTLPQGAAVSCEIVQGDRGPQVTRILSVEPPTGPYPADRGEPFDARYPGSPAAALASSVMELPGTVKFFDPARGFGFVVPDSGGREVYVHSSVLFRSGMTDLSPGQRVFVRAESVPRGLQATDIEPM